MCLVYPMLSVSLYCPSLIAPSVFIVVYLYNKLYLETFITTVFNLIVYCNGCVIYFLYFVAYF